MEYKCRMMTGNLMLPVRSSRFFPRLRFALAILLFALLHCVVSAGEPDAVQTLKEAKSFAFGGVGIAGIITESETAYWQVFESKDAAAEFKRLLSSGTPAAQCYALVGLRSKDRPAYDAEVKAFKTSKTIVETAAGCMISNQPIASVVAQIEAGSFDQREKPRK